MDLNNFNGNLASIQIKTIKLVATNKPKKPIGKKTIVIKKIVTKILTVGLVACQNDFLLMYCSNEFCINYFLFLIILSIHIDNSSTVLGCISYKASKALFLDINKSII